MRLLRLYRVQPTDNVLKAVVLARGNKKVNGDVVEIAEKFCRVGMDGDASIFLPVASQVMVAFLAEKLKAPVRVSALVEERKEMEGDVTLHKLRFTNPSELDRQLTPAVHKLFNRRRAVRVAPDGESPIRVLVECAAVEFRTEVPLLDVSMLGLGIEVIPAMDDKLSRVKEITCTFSLPGCRRPLKVESMILFRAIHRIDTQPRIRYGMEFIPEKTKRFDVIEDAIVEFVMMRQREFAQQKS